MTRITAIAIQAVRVIKIPFEINKEGRKALKVVIISVTAYSLLLNTFGGALLLTNFLSDRQNRSEKDWFILFLFE